MITRLLLFLGAMVFQHLALAQSKPNNIFDHLSIGFQAGYISTFNYTPRYEGFRYFECHSLKQTPINSYLWDMSIAYSFNEKHAVEWRLGSSQIGYYDSGNCFSGFHFEVERIWKLKGTELLYQWTFLRSSKLNTFIKSGLRVEKITGGEGKENFNKIHPMLAFRPGVFVEVTKKVSVHLNGLFKTGVRRFNKRDGYSRYIPYGFGGEVGVSFNLRH